MKYFIFRKFKFNHIFFICQIIISFIRKRAIEYLIEEPTQTSGYFYKYYMTVISHFLSFIPLLIKINCNKKKKSETDNKGQIKLIYDENTPLKAKNIIKNTYKVSIFDMLADSTITLFYFFNNKKEVEDYYSMRIITIYNSVMQYVVSHYVLKTSLYKHHYLSFLINIFCVIVFLIIDIIKIVESNIIDYQYYIFSFLKIVRLTFFCFQDSYSKNAFILGFLSPYELILSRGIYGFCFLIIFSIPFIFLKTDDSYVHSNSIFTGFSTYFKEWKILLTFGFLIIQFLNDLFWALIIDRFSPNHLTIPYIFEALSGTIYKIIKDYINKNNTDYFNYFNFIIYIILFIGAMIYNEILIIKIWGLNEKTKLFLRYECNDERKYSEDLDDEYNLDDNDNTKKDDNMIQLNDVQKGE